MSLLPPAPDGVHGPEWLPSIEELNSWLSSGGHTAWQCGGSISGQSRLRVTVEFGEVVARIRLRESVEEYGRFLKTTMIGTDTVDRDGDDDQSQPPWCRHHRADGASAAPMVPVQPMAEVKAQPPIDTHAHVRMGHAILKIQAFMRGRRVRLQKGREPLSKDVPSAPAAVSLGGAPSGVAHTTESASSATSPWVAPLDVAQLKELIRSELRSMAREMLTSLQQAPL